MDDYEYMTKLHREADRLLDNYQTATLSKKDANYVNKFLVLDRSRQIQRIRRGIQEIHPQFEEPEIAKAASQILFKIQLSPHNATSFGMGTPASQVKKPGRGWRFWQ